MVIDSSCIAAIMFDEPDASVYISAILNDVTRLMSAATLVEISMVVMRLLSPDPITALDALLAHLNVVVVPFDHEQAILARDAFRRFGRGRHSAGLNYGDCLSYALSKHTGEPLLFKGKDFMQTDVAVA
jgi:ribonuclease VapC